MTFPNRRHGQSQFSSRSAVAIWLGAALLATSASVAQAQGAGVTDLARTTAPANVLNLSASAVIEVPQDVLIVVYSTTREGSDAQSVQSGLKQALDAALAEARKAAQPGQVEVSTGGFRLSPRYGPKSQITGWQGSAELITQGKDTAALAQLSGRISTMTIARVAHDLSRETRTRVETDATAQAIAKFRAKASDMSRAFGFASYSVREVQVHSDGPQREAPEALMRGKAHMSAAAEALPMEPGKATVTAVVTGSVQMSK